MATAPLLETFNSSKDDWNVWSRRFEQWLTLSSYSTGDDAAAKKRLLQQLLTQDHKKPLAELMELAHTFKAAEQESLKCVDTNRSETIVAASKAKFQGHSKLSRSTRQRSGGDQQGTPAATTGNSHSLQCASCGGEHS